jgi:hypothetical protein
LGAEEIIFNARPTSKNGKSLKSSKSEEFGIMIKKKDRRLLWASRGSRELIYSRSGIFHIFVDPAGSGFISIMDTSTLPDGVNKGARYMYGEHIRAGVGTISYIGEASYFLAPVPSVVKIKSGP